MPLSKARSPQPWAILFLCHFSIADFGHSFWNWALSLSATLLLVEVQSWLNLGFFCPWRAYRTVSFTKSLNTFSPHNLIHLEAVLTQEAPVCWQILCIGIMTLQQWLKLIKGLSLTFFLLHSLCFLVLQWAAFSVRKSFLTSILNHSYFTVCSAKCSQSVCLLISKCLACKNHYFIPSSVFFPPDLKTAAS